MAGKTTNKLFRYPDGGDPVSDVDIANLVTDFDVEIRSQLDNKRAKLRNRPMGVMEGTNSVTANAGGSYPLPMERIDYDPSGLCDLANKRFTINAASGAGLYVVIVTGNSRLTNANMWSIGIAHSSGATLAWNKGSSNATSRTAFGAAYMNVGDYVSFTGYRDGTGTSDYFSSTRMAAIFKMSD